MAGGLFLYEKGPTYAQAQGAWICGATLFDHCSIILLKQADQNAWPGSAVTVPLCKCLGNLACCSSRSQVLQLVGDDDTGQWHSGEAVAQEPRPEAMRIPGFQLDWAARLDDEAAASVSVL